MSLPKFQTKDQSLSQLQITWAQAIDPVVNNILTKGNLLTNVPLINGANVINHKLGKKLTGWIITGINGVAGIYDTQASNSMPELTLQLVSNAAVTVNIYAF